MFSGEVTSDFYSCCGFKPLVQCSGVRFLPSACCRLPNTSWLMDLFLSLSISSPWQMHALHLSSCISQQGQHIPGCSETCACRRVLHTWQTPRRIHPNSWVSLSLLPVCAGALLQDGCPKQQMTDCCLAQWSGIRRRQVVRNVLLSGWKMHHL